MKENVLLGAAAVVIAASCGFANEFPLEFKKLNGNEAMTFPGGSGLYGSLQAERPAGIGKEPPATSKHPLYCQLSTGKKIICARIDESKGDGRGYDSLIVDMNRNGDLTDDSVAERIVEPGRPSTQTEPEIVLFGPVAAPDDKKLGESQLIYFVQAYIYARSAIAVRSASGTVLRNLYLGQLRMRPGWYLETTVEVDGVSRKVGVLDENCSFRPEEMDQPTMYKNGGDENWYFQGGDYFLVDNNNLGTFENSVGADEAVPFASILYLGAKPYKAVVAADCKSLSVEPWTEPLAELDLKPHGDQVSSVQLAWEKAPGNWQLLEPGIENGKAKVPPGNYRLCATSIKARMPSGDTVHLSGYKRSLQPTIKADADARTELKCGAPLEIKVTVQRNTLSTAQDSGLLSRLGRLLWGSDQPLEELIQASVFGAGGETFSSFYLTSKGQTLQPAKPVFTISDSAGRKIDSGNMEFG